MTQSYENITLEHFFPTVIISIDMGHTAHIYFGYLYESVVLFSGDSQTETYIIYQWSC